LLLQATGPVVPVSQAPFHLASTTAWSGRGSGIAPNDALSGQNPVSITPITVPAPASRAPPKRCCHTPSGPVSPSMRGEWLVRVCTVSFSCTRATPGVRFSRRTSAGERVAANPLNTVSNVTVARLRGMPAAVRTSVRRSPRCRRYGWTPAAVRASRAPDLGRVAAMPATPPSYEATGSSASCTR
jgi:hypothetical protein